MTWSQNLRQRLWGAWMSIQVELHGRYSLERLQQLETYSSNLSAGRMTTLFLLTPLPCLMFSLLKEALPLNPPEAGVHDNAMFWVRSWLVAGLIGSSALVKMGQGSPRLKLKAFQVAFISFLSGGIAVIVIFGICAATVFPLPFGVLLAAPPDVLVLAICFGYVFGPRLKAEPALWNDINQQSSVYNCQVALTFVYPLYIFGFVSLTGIYQAMFVVVLPIIKLIAKNWVSHSLTGYDDVKPQYVIFIVEVFNALYVSNALQSASSWSLTAIIMAVDLLHFWLSMLDVMQLFNEMKALMAKIPRDHPIANDNFLQVALKMVAIDGKPNNTRKQTQDDVEKLKVLLLTSQPAARNIFTSFRDSFRKIVPDGETDAGRDGRTFDKRKLFQGATVAPMQVAKKITTHNREPELITTTDGTGLTSMFSKDERSRFVNKTTHVLFITEYIVLVEYVEVVLPIVYSLYRVTLFNMPNSAYFTSMAGLTSAQLWSSVHNVLAYSSLEFVSLIIALVILKHSLGFSSMRQLAFVLETHVGMIQATLIDIFIYVSQVQLAHLGADFSFKFAWLHKSNP